MTIEIKHRFGGHGGVPTEWEIRVDHDDLAIAILRKHSSVDGVQISAPFHGSVILPEGVHAALAGELAAHLAALDESAFLVTLEQCRRPTPRAVCLVVQREDGKVLAVSRKKDYHKPESEWRFGLPGGKVDPGEDSITALIREVKEETGYDVADPVYMYSSICPGRVTYVSEFFGGKISGTEGTSEPIHIRWVDFEVLLEGPFAFSIGRLQQHLAIHLHEH